jgi:hypothetical protein
VGRVIHSSVDIFVNLDFPSWKVAPWTTERKGLTMNDDTRTEAHEALDAVERARSSVRNEVGLPRWYWWLLAAGWLVLGVLGDFGPQSLAVGATIAFVLAHGVLASRVINGRRRTNRLQVSEATAGRRTPLIVVGMMFVLVAATIAAGFALHADGARHAGTGAAVLAAAIVGLGGPEALRVGRRWLGA